MDAKSVAQNAGANNLSPAPYIKDVLAQNYLVLPVNKNDTTPLFSQDISRALLHESILYVLRSMSQLVSYEAIYTKHEFSWALVTLYYSNYFSVLSMNRLAGNAVSTVKTNSNSNSNSYEISTTTNPTYFNIKKIQKNNHILVWQINYKLYGNFNWIDSSCDQIIVKVNNNNYYEKTIREYMNYHPDSYRELLQTKTNHSVSLSFFGKNYMNKPDNIASLPFDTDLEKDIANLECRAIYRQMIVLTILREVVKILEPTSKSIVISYFRSFSKNIMDKNPFKSKLKSFFHDIIHDLSS
jgi:hypothetical protein